MTGEHHPQDSETTTAPQGVSLLLVRHGRTALNAAGQLRGRLDPPLDEIGVVQVAALAHALAPYRPALVVSSPLTRALQTAAPIARVSGVEVLVDEDLIDRDYGRWAGHTPAEVEDQWGSVDRAPGVEPWESLSGRAAGMLHKDFGAGPVVLVTHDAVLHAMLQHLDPGYTTAPHDPAGWDVLTLDEAGQLHLDGINLHASRQPSRAQH
ncbi:MAG: histidine phosphatase family protein [Propionibacterium sp.]